MTTQQKIPFGISLNGQRSYTLSEVDNFIECADNIFPETFRNKYIAFLKNVLSKKFKRSALVDIECLESFYYDLDNRAQIDYREGHYCPVDEADIYNGGKYFHNVASKLKQHIQKHDATLCTANEY